MSISTLAASDIMSSPVYAVSPKDTVAHARNLMVRHKISRVLVMDEGKLSGILTKKDIGYRLPQQGAVWRRRPPDQFLVAEYEKRDPVTVTPVTLARFIAGIFIAKNIGGVPVIDNGVVTGIVTKSDLMKSALVADLRGTVQDVMEDVITANRWHSLAHIVGLMKERDKNLVVTNNDGSVAGIITETSLAFHDESRMRSGGISYEEPKRKHEIIGIAGRPDAPDNVQLTAGDVMTSPVVTVAPVSTLPHAVALMQSEQVNNFVVVEHNALIGILKRDDIIKEVAK
jgi:CBS domain-containing protein